MDYTCNGELKFFRAKMAADQIPQKLLAYKFNISASMLSQYLNGTLKMPERIRDGLISELNLRSVMERLATNNKEAD